MTIRLTNDLRAAITAAAITNAFDKKKSLLEKVESELAIEAYKVVFSKNELDAVTKLPKNWVRYDECLRFNVAGQSITLNTRPGLAVPYSVAGARGYGCHILGVIESGELCDRIQKHAADKETYKAIRSSTQKKLEAMLNKITTLKKLREVWPEGVEFYQKYEEPKQAALPAIRMDEINVALGL